MKKTIEIILNGKKDSIRILTTTTNIYKTCDYLDKLIDNIDNPFEAFEKIKEDIPIIIPKKILVNLKNKNIRVV